MSLFKKVALTSLVIILTLVSVFFIWLYAANYHPDDIQSEEVTCSPDAKVLQKNQSLRVLSWNVQYMAGKNYYFFYDTSHGKDIRPSSKDIALTTTQVAKVITEVNPDVVLFQELDEDATRTDFRNQLKDVMGQMSAEYKCQASTFYWKSSFVPHPKIWGKVGLKLATVSKFKIESATRYQLPLMTNDFISRQFYLKRAILETRLTIEGQAKPLAILNTHLDAFAIGTDTLQRQVDYTVKILDDLTEKNVPWLIGGDFNLLPPGQINKLLPIMQKSYKENTESKIFFEKYQAVPSLKNLNSHNVKYWFTHFPNDPKVKAPDRTIDYIFLSKDRITLNGSYVKQGETWKMSDHLPVVVGISVK